MMHRLLKAYRTSCVIGHVSTILREEVYAGVYAPRGRQLRNKEGVGETDETETVQGLYLLGSYRYCTRTCNAQSRNSSLWQ
jgi:hypothetical protein